MSSNKAYDDDYIMQEALHTVHNLNKIYLNLYIVNMITNVITLMYLIG